MSDIQSSHRGLLHKAMGVPQGKKLTIGDIMATKAKAKRTGDSKLEKQATYAANVRK